MKKKVEILAPAGSFESMKAAVAAGADAVYMGGSRFGARAYADNPDEEGMLEAIDYVHLHGCQLYMTVNTLVKDSEYGDLGEYLEPYYERGLDAVIVQDMGVFSYIHSRFPDLPIHASTQMTITGPAGARMMMRMGASRIVTARELSLEEISRIYRETGAEIESFVHGALCYCYSGQCLFSSLIGGRSGNRGRCAQTCRLPFDVKRDGRILNRKDERYVLSLKDLCTLDLLPDILDAGVYSLKIEGRMKSPRYTAGVVSIYRKYADLYLEKGRKGYRVDPADRKKLVDLFDRGGQTDGYYRRHNGRDMVVMKEKPAFREENREYGRFLDETYVDHVQREPVTGFVSVREGEPLMLTLSCPDRLADGDLRTVTVTGEPVQTALNQPMSEERIIKQIGKTGNTPFYFEDLQAELAGMPFVPVQMLNDLRRRGFEELEQAFRSAYARPAAAEPEEPEEEEEASAFAVPALTVSVERPDQLPGVLSRPEVEAVYPDAAGFGAEIWKQTAESCRQAGKKCFLLLPHIYRSEAERYLKEHRQEFSGAGFDGMVVRAWEELSLLADLHYRGEVLLDYTVYTMNRSAERFIRQMAPDLSLRFTLPAELNFRELAEHGCRGRELIVYGATPMMVTAQCMKKTVEKCTGKPEVLTIRDRMGKEFPVVNHCRFCYNTIYNSSPLSLLKERKRVLDLQPSSIRLSFTTEDEETVRSVTRAFADAFLYGKETVLAGEFTRGHFKRGVE